MNDGLTLPLELVTEDGRLVAALLMNRKAQNKSLERGEVWVVVPQADGSAGRVLPLEGAAFRSLEVVAGSRYRAVLSEAAAAAVTASVQQVWAGLADRDLAPPAAAGTGKQPTLERLRAVIARRRQERPEGSYTTLLFAKGEEKIRKKTGEEAIELLLAQTDADLISEAADLLYHLMVLLEVRDLDIAQVLDELERRMV